MSREPATTVEELQAELGDDLRAVATFDPDGYDVHYMRDDVKAKRDDRYLDEIHDDLVLQGIQKDHLERLFDAGELRCTMHRFDDLTAFHFVEAANRGFFVAIESDAAVDLRTFCRTCEHEG